MRSFTIRLCGYFAAAVFCIAVFQEPPKNADAAPAQSQSTQTLPAPGAVPDPELTRKVQDLQDVVYKLTDRTAALEAEVANLKRRETPASINPPSVPSQQAVNYGNSGACASGSCSSSGFGSQRGFGSRRAILPWRRR